MCFGSYAVVWLDVIVFVTLWVWLGYVGCFCVVAYLISDCGVLVCFVFDWCWVYWFSCFLYIVCFCSFAGLFCF